METTVLLLTGDDGTALTDLGIILAVMELVECKYDTLLLFSFPERWEGLGGGKGGEPGM